MLAHEIGDLENMLTSGNREEDPEKKVDLSLHLPTLPFILVLFALCYILFSWCEIYVYEKKMK